MPGDLAFQKALLRADRGDIEGDEESLRELLAAEPVSPLRVQGLVVLGELLSTHDDPEHRTVLAEAIETAEQIEDAADVLGYELNLARELLG